MLLSRIKGNKIAQHIIKNSKTTAYNMKIKFMNDVLEERIELKFDDLRYIFYVILALNTEDIVNHERYIKAILLEIYDKYYEKLESNDATYFRKALCRIDEVLYME